MPNYTKLQDFVTGQIIGRATMGILEDNDRYFSGLAFRWRPWMHSPSVLGVGGNSYIFWNGYHLLRDDAMLLHYWFQVTGGASNSATATMYYYKDNGTAYEVDSVTAAANATQTRTGTLDLSNVSGITAGLHRIRFSVSYTVGDPGTGRARTPYTTYTGSEVFINPRLIRDGYISNAADFERWRTNDEYFQACCPNNPAFHMISVGDPTNGNGELIWDGYVRHSTGHERVNYRLKMSTDDNNNRLVIFYDYNGAKEEYGIMDTAGSYVEGGFDLTASKFDHGEWYRVAVVEQRDAATAGAYVWVDYVYMGPTSSMVYLDAMEDFTVNNWVYGDTGGPRLDALIRLSYWDYYIFTVMCYNAGIGRMDWAVRDDSALQPYNPIVTHRIKRIYDFLWYRGTGIAMEWGVGGSRSLPDTDATNPVQIMDLRSVSDLAYGQHYTLRGNVQFAMEAVYSA